MPDVRPIRFRIHPEGRSLYFRVNVWPTRDDVIRHSRKAYGHAIDDDGLRAYFSKRTLWRVGEDGRKRLLPYLGEINFARDDIGAGLVAHEMGHATLEWARRVRLIVEGSPPDAARVDDTEERFCIALGELVRQFYCRAQRLGLY